MVTQEYLDKADKGDFVEVAEGIYLGSQELMKSEQSNWGETDKTKHFDFSKADYWITDDSGMEPIPINDLEDLLDILSN